METIWFLILFSLLHPPFEGGQFQTEDACRAAARVIVMELRRGHGRLKWVCREGKSFEEVIGGRYQ